MTKKDLTIIILLLFNALTVKNSNDNTNSGTTIYFSFLLLFVVGQVACLFCDFELLASRCEEAYGSTTQ
jgi:hypothetical protein